MTSRHPITPWMGWLIIVVAVLSTASMAVTAHQQSEVAQEQREAVERQAKCNEAFKANLTARVKWNDEDRNALKALIVSVFEDDRDPVQFKAYQEWLDTVERNDAKRARVSLPALARC